MRLRQAFTIVFAVCMLSGAALAQRKICIGNVSGGDASTFNIQQPLFDSIKKEAGSRGDNVQLQLMATNNEKGAKGEMSSLKCDYAVMANISREWPQPKGGMSTGAGGGGGKDDNPHPASTSRFHFALLDKGGKRIDKFETSIEMQIRYTAKDVQPQVQDILQEVANWTLDGTIPSK